MDGLPKRLSSLFYAQTKKGKFDFDFEEQINTRNMQKWEVKDGKVAKISQFQVF